MLKTHHSTVFYMVSTETLTGLVTDVMAPSKITLDRCLKMTPEILMGGKW